MALSPCNTTTDASGRELVDHGTDAFPLACYHDDLTNAPVPWHWHEELEAALVTQGSVVLTLEGTQYTLPTGSGFFINSGILHGALDVDDSHGHLHSLVFHPRLISGREDSVFHQKYLSPLIDDPILEFLCFSPDTDWHRQALDAMEGAWQACLREETGYEFEARTQLSRFIHLICLHTAQTTPTRSPRRDSQRIKTMLRFLHNNYAEPLDTRAIAQSAAISDSECLRCFHTALSTTPIRYLRQYRIRRAAQLLLSSEEKIADIGFRCGFQDLSYFAKIFREEQGLSPSEFRLKHRGNS